MSAARSQLPELELLASATRRERGHVSHVRGGEGVCSRAPLREAARVLPCHSSPGRGLRGFFAFSRSFWPACGVRSRRVREHEPRRSSADDRRSGGLRPCVCAPALVTRACVRFLGSDRLRRQCRGQRAFAGHARARQAPPRGSRSRSGSSPNPDPQPQWRDRVADRTRL